LRVTATPDPVAPSALLTYTFVVTNTGSSDLTNVVLTDQTRNAASAIIADSTGTPSCGGAGSCGPGVLVKWPAFTLVSGASQTVAMTSLVGGYTPNGTIIHNDATLAYTGGNIIQSTEVSTHQ
jgi:hypothetical protein